MPAFDPIQQLITITDNWRHLLLKDFNCLTPEQQVTSPAKGGRTAVDILAECAMVNGIIAYHVANSKEGLQTVEEIKASQAGKDTPEAAVAYLNEQTDILKTTIQSLDPDTLEDKMSPFGFEATRYFMAEFGGVHMCYHDGQLNYIQSLNGDDKVHWSEA